MPDIKALVRNLLNLSSPGRWLLELYRQVRAADGASSTTSTDAGDAVNRLAASRSETLGARWHVASASRTRPHNDIRVTISAVMHNNARWLEGFMFALLASSYDLQRVTLVFVDNGSTDDSLEVAQKWVAKHLSRFEHAAVVSRPNLGYGTGNDYAIRNCDTEFALVTNIDVAFHCDMLSTLVDFTRHDDADVASWEARQYPFEHPKYYDPVTLLVNWQSHACVLFRRSAYLAAGGYDPALFMYGEDVELSYRFRSSGYRLRYVPTAVVFHHLDPQKPRPLQVSGSIAANLLIRYRYGTIHDRLVGEGMLAAIGRTATDDLTTRELSRARDLVRENRDKFRKSKRPPANTAAFPFRGFDYEMIRSLARYRPDQPFLDGPKVSVVTRTVPGRAWLLREAIASVMNQTYRNIEHIVVEQGQGGAQEEVERLASVYGRDIRYVKGDRVGRSATGNLGLSAATGEYVMFLDDDDLLFSDHIEVLAEALFNNADAEAAHAPSWEVHTEIDHQRRTYAERLHQLPPALAGPFTNDDVLHHNIAPIQAVMFRRSIYTRLGGFHEDMHMLEDWNLWVRYAHAGSFFFVSKLTSLFRTPFDHEQRFRRDSELHAAYPKAQARNVSDIARIVRGGFTEPIDDRV
ncbi:MAG: glycosyltransferase [Xanthobacteraceae bacterium]